MRGPLDPAAVRAYMARDWGAVREAKRQYWRDRLDRGGLVEALRVSEQLRDQAAHANPAWPTEKDREEDLETHQRVAKALASTAPPERRSASARARTPRVR